MKKFIVVLLGCATLAGCGGTSASTQHQLEQFKNDPQYQKDQARLKKESRKCIDKEGGIFKLKTKAGRHQWIACMVPPTKKVKAQACSQKYMKVAFTKKKLQLELQQTLHCIARL